ncbi:MAG: hypothetical protein ACQEUY_10895 [Pseudomonadota bacterium]
MPVGTGVNGSGLHFILSLFGVDDIAVIDLTHRVARSKPFDLVLNLGSLDAAALLDRDASLTIWQDGEPLSIINTSAGSCRGLRGHPRPARAPLADTDGDPR